MAQAQVGTGVIEQTERLESFELGITSRPLPTADLKARIQEQLEKFGTHLNCERWTPALSSYLRQKEVKDPILLTVEADFDDLSCYSNDDAEAEQLRNFLTEVSRNRTASVEKLQHELCEGLTEFSNVFLSLELQAKNVESALVRIKEHTGSAEDLLTIAKSKTALSEQQLQTLFSRSSSPTPMKPLASHKTTVSETKQQIQELLTCLAPELDLQNWTPTLALYIRMKGVSVLSLSEDTAYSELSEYAKDETEAEHLRNFLRQVSLQDRSHELQENLDKLSGEFLQMISALQNLAEEVCSLLHRVKDLSPTNLDVREILCKLTAEQLDTLFRLAGHSPPQKYLDESEAKATAADKAKPAPKAENDTVSQQKQTKHASKRTKRKKDQHRQEENKRNLVRATATTTYEIKNVDNNQRQLKGQKYFKSCLMKLVSRLKLEQYYPKGLSHQRLTQIVHVDPDRKSDSEQASTVPFRSRKTSRTGRTEGDSVSKNGKIGNVALGLLQGLLSYNATARDQVPGAKSGEAFSLCAFLEGDAADDKEGHFNPMDVLLVCYLSCDEEMQQILCRALFACKLAFPFIYANMGNALVMSHWSLRDIIVEYRDQKDRYIETSFISEHPFPIVSFMRMGEVNLSKSRLLNSMLNGGVHATFFHRDCANGDVRRLCSNGMVEAAMFMPNVSNKSFDTAFLAVNLRGDMIHFSGQVSALAEVSQIFVVFVDIEMLANADCVKALTELKEAQVKLIIVLSRKSARQTQLKTSCQLVTLLETSRVVTSVSGSQQRNESELLSEAKEALSAVLRGTEGRAFEPRSDKFILDENGTVENAKKMRDSVMKFFADADAATFKQIHLPLQELWMDYSKMYKSEHSSKADFAQQTKSQTERMEKRNAQIDPGCLNLSPFVEHFIQCLSAAASGDADGLTAKLFLQWMKLSFDECTRSILPQMFEQRNLLRDILQQGHETVENVPSGLQALERKILNSSVGLENVFREVGQIYEAAQENSIQVPEKLHKLRTLVEPLPKLFAQLLLWGVPLEILDGDAGNIPSSWISEILKCCKELTGDKKILVVSVLGLQSSGKSTLLNTMFGLKFAVSAGRCTRDNQTSVSFIPYHFFKWKTSAKRNRCGMRSTFPRG